MVICTLLSSFFSGLDYLIEAPRDFADMPVYNGKDFYAVNSGSVYGERLEAITLLFIKNKTKNSY